MNKILNLLEQKPKLMAMLFLAIIIATFMVGLLIANIMEKRTQSQVLNRPKVKIDQFDSDNEKWGKSFPKEYETFLKTKEMNFKSKHNSNMLVDILEEDPNLVILWAGYGFAKDYNQPRGHMYAVEDLQNSLRTGGPTGPHDGPMPNTCWTCKSPDVPRMMNKVGVSEFYKGKWSSRGHQVQSPVGCADCHDAETMDLKITRPALIEAFDRMGKDITKATHQEMRSLVCAQCHVEYYFKGKGKELTFPWDNGMGMEDMEKYYDENKVKDWTHKLSRAPMLKAQHPGYETYRHGIHGKRGVSCADCHMPYVTEGGVKFTDHHIQSPLNNINNSCQVCHRESEEELKANVFDKQDKVKDIRMNVEQQLVRAHIEAKRAWDVGAKEEEMSDILQDIRHAQWRWDYAVAAHGASFHASLEVTRALGKAMDKTADARRKLAKLLARYGEMGEVSMPDISTKAKAQAYIGLDKAKMDKEKALFKKNLLPKWKEEYKKKI